MPRNLAWGDVAAGLGADVPVCLGARAALIGGTGEIVVPLVTAPELHLLLVNPSRPLSTAAVFNAYPGPPQAFHPVQDEFAGLQGPAMVSRLSEHRNDLRAAACELCPDIRDVLGALGSAPECRTGPNEREWSDMFWSVRDLQGVRQGRRSDRGGASRLVGSRNTNPWLISSRQRPAAAL